MQTNDKNLLPAYSGGKEHLWLDHAYFGEDIFPMKISN